MKKDIGKIYSDLENQQLNLNKEFIDRCNSLSMYNAGNNIVNTAQANYKAFFPKFPLNETYTDEQTELIVQRATSYKSLIEEAYNDNLYRRSNIVPVNIAGPSNYPADKMNKLMDAHMKSENMWIEKMNRFIDNTFNMIENLTPVEKVIEDYGNGKRSSEPISSSDPHALEKLTAKLEYSTNLQSEMKKANAHYRKNDTMAGYKDLTDIESTKMDEDIRGGYSFNQQPYPSFMLTNNNANMKTIKKRIESIASHRTEQKIQGYKFDGGEVVANYEIDRLQIFFDEKPDEEMRKTLKGSAFRWSPKNNNAWQRQLTSNAIYSAKRILPETTQEQVQVDAEIAETEENQTEITYGGMSL